MKKILIFLILLLSVSALKAQTWKKLDSIAAFYIEDEDLGNAGIYVHKALDEAKNTYGTESVYYAKSLSDVAFYNYLKSFTIDKSKKTIDSVRVVFENIHDTVNDRYLRVCYYLNYIYDDCYDYDKAEWCAKKCLEISKTTDGEKSQMYASYLHNLAWVYLHKNNFSMAWKYFEQSYTIYRDYVRQDNESYAFMLNSIATYYIERGFDNLAEPFIKKSLEIRKKIYGEKNRWYAKQLSNLGAYYFRLGRYEDAEPIMKKSADIILEMYGDNDATSAYAYHNLAYIEWRKNNLAGAEKYLIKTLWIFEKLKITDYPEYYIKFKKSLATFYNETGESSKAEVILKDALEKCRVRFGENSLNTSEILSSLAYTYYLIGDYETAGKLYEEAISIDREILGGESSDYGSMLSSLAEVYHREGRDDKADELYLSSNNFYIERINKFYNSLSEKEKLEFNRTITPHIEKFFSFAVKRCEADPEIAGEIMNLSIASKGLILNSVTAMKNAIQNSGDSVLLGKYERLLYLRQMLSTAYAMQKEELNKKGINITVIETEANNIEKELASSSLINFRAEGTSWREIKEKMNSDECFVEFINFRTYNKKFSDTIVYYAGIIKKDFQYPVFVRLCAQQDISEILSVRAEDKTSYQMNVETGRRLYGFVFAPVEKYLNGIGTVYLSPEGILNKISFAALNTGGERLLGDSYKLRYLTNIKDYLTTEKSFESHADYFEVIFGGINYDFDSSGVIINKENTRGEKDEEWIPPANMIVCDVPRSSIKKWNFLHGTLEETEKIKSISGMYGMNALMITGSDAREERIKYFTKKNSPRVLHLATHGFFFPEPIGSSTSGSNPFKHSVNPLLRSGLLLAGANRVWLGGNEIEGVENGILTAYEVSNMDLANTELVVLSACETGLGDIKGGEGVFGLQRAFKIAGAKNIIMSLWKVPDKETVELMELFYEKWLGGMTKYDAFASAQNEMRKKYLPYYWAAFVLVE